MHGIGTSVAEVTNASSHCFWLLLADEELAVPFAEFPWFKQVTIEQLLDVERPTLNLLAATRYRSLDRVDPQPRRLSSDLAQCNAMRQP